MTDQIEIVHTHADGTLATGTRRGDGSAEILKAHNWRWSRQLETWYIPRSRDQLAKTAVIEATRDALKSAGFEVSLEINDPHPGPSNSARPTMMHARRRGRSS